MNKTGSRNVTGGQPLLDCAALIIMIFPSGAFRDALPISQTPNRRRNVNLRAISSARFTHFSEFPPAMQKAARSRRIAILNYYKAIEEGRTKEIAKKLAAAEWKKFFGKKCNELTVRKWVKKVERYGGPDAPVEAFLDGKSCAHPNQCTHERVLKRKRRR